MGDGALPSQFSCEEQEQTRLGKFIMKHGVVLTAIICPRFQHRRDFKEFIPYDACLTFPGLGLINRWVMLDDEPILPSMGRAPGVSAYDFLDDTLREFALLEEARMFSSGRDDGFKYWCHDSNMDERLMSSYCLFDDIRRAHDKARIILPSAVWTEMVEARIDDDADSSK